MAARFDWETIRAEYETGSTMGALSRRHGVTKAAISQRAKREGWVQDISGAVNRLAEAKVNGIVNTVNPQKKAEALDRAADAKAAVMRRHKEEWERHQQLIDEALAAGDFDKAKLAKITAETLKIRQEGERRAWGIKDSAEEARAADVSVKVDLGAASPEKISSLVDAAYGEGLGTRVRQ
ncbi:hypothetical protein [Desulfovibrio sp.]|uniref:hypothetical protein n=1 Tax=Desulfovibrio sp. TaxID=885 RepID=UPI0025C50164|nr:hypothetical protein [Desulfovibrio sp.]